MYKVKNRRDFWAGRSERDGSYQPDKEAVKKIIGPVLKSKGILVGKAIGNGNMSSVFNAKKINGDEVIVKAVCTRDDLIHHLGFEYFDRVARKEISVLSKLNALTEESSVKLIETLEIPIEYTSLMDKKHIDKVVVLVLEKYSDFSMGRDKNQRMRYSKEVRVLINRYGEEVFAACLGKWLIQEILRLYRLNIIHRDIKTGNILVKHLCKDLFETKFVLVDWGSSHLKSFDAYSGSNDPIDFKDYTEAEGAGTLKYYPPISTEGKHTYRSELFACAMVLCDVFGYLRETNLSVRFNIEHDENVSAEMKRALLILSDVDPDKRDYTSALKIFDSIIDKYKSSLVDKKSSKEFSAEQKNHKKEAASTDITCSFDEVVDLLSRGKYESARDKSKYLTDNSIRTQRLKAILSFLNDSNSDIARLRFRAISDKDVWSAYCESVLTTNKSERGRLLKSLYNRTESEEIIHPLVAYHMFELHKEKSVLISEHDLEEIKSEAIKVNPEKSDFKSLLNIAVRS